MAEEAIDDTELQVEEQAQESADIAAQAPNLDLEQTKKLIQDHMELLKAQQNSPKTRREEPEVDPEDLMTVGMAQKAFKELQRANEELRVAAKHKDYEEVITKFLPEAIKENPNIRRWIESSESPYEQAYYLAKKSDAYLKEMALKGRSKEAEKIGKINKTAGNLSSIGANSSASTTVDYKNMNDDEFRQLMARNMGY